MAESNLVGSKLDVNGLQLQASRWLMSVHAAWDLRLENSQVESDSLRLIYKDSLSAQHTVVMGASGEVVSYIGPFSGRAGPQARGAGAGAAEVTSRFTTAAPAAAPFAERAGIAKSPEPVSFYRPPEPPAAAPAIDASRGSPETKVLGWIRESIGIVNVSIKEKGMKDQMVHYLIEDQSGGKYHVVAQLDGTVRRFEPFTAPAQGSAGRPGEGAPERPAPPKAPAPATVADGTGAAPQADIARSVSIARTWLADNIGLTDVQVKESRWEKNRLRLDFSDRGRNVFRLYVTDTGKVEEFKPI